MTNNPPTHDDAESEAERVETWTIYVCECGAVHDRPDAGCPECTSLTHEQFEVVPLMLLTEALEYVAHQSWRCEYPDRYPWEPDCPCGLTALRAKLSDVKGPDA